MMIAPSKLQKGAARTVVSLLEKLGVIQRVASYEKARILVKNSPYEPLEITKNDDEIAFITYVNEDGQTVIDSKCIFEIDFTGVMCLQSMVTRGTCGQQDQKSESLANIFAMNLINHGYDQGTVIWKIPHDPTQVMGEDDVQVKLDFSQKEDVQGEEPSKSAEVDENKDEYQGRYNQDPGKIFGSLLSAEPLGNASLETFMPLDGMVFKTKEGEISNGIWLIRKDYTTDEMLDRALHCKTPLRESDTSSEKLWLGVQDRSRALPVKFEFGIKGYKKGDLMVYSTKAGELIAFLADHISWFQKIIPDFRLLYFTDNAMALILSGNASAGFIKRIIIEEISGLRVNIRFLAKDYPEVDELADETVTEEERVELIKQLMQNTPELQFTLDSTIGDISMAYDLMNDVIDRMREAIKPLLDVYRKKLIGIQNSDSAFSKATLLKITEMESLERKFKLTIEERFKAARENLDLQMRAEISKLTQNVSEWMTYIQGILFAPMAREEKMKNDDSIVSSTTVREIIGIAIEDMSPKQETKKQSENDLFSQLKPLSMQAERIFRKLVQGLNQGEARKIDTTSGTFMPVNIEWLYDQVYSIAHYWTQNGDLMSDPRMEFMVFGEKVYPVHFRQDGMPACENEVLYHDEQGNLKIRNIKVQKDIAGFANTWMKNIKEQQKEYFSNPVPPEEKKLESKTEPVEPWKLTREEYVSSLGLDARKIPPKPMRMSARMVKLEDGTTWSTDDHGKAVYKAAMAGKPVNENVLREYIEEPWAKKALGIEDEKPQDHSDTAVKSQLQKQEEVERSLEVNSDTRKVRISQRIPLKGLSGQTGIVISSRTMPDMVKMYTVRLDSGQLRDPFDGQLYDPEISEEYIVLEEQHDEKPEPSGETASPIASTQGKFLFGERVVLVTGQYHGRHGSIEEVNDSHLTIVDGKTNQAIVFKVRTDNGLSVQVTENCIEKEDTKLPEESIIPDVMTEDGYELPETVYLRMQSFKKKADKYSEMALQERDRYRRSSLILEYHTIMDKGRKLAAVYREWAQKNEKEAVVIKEKYKPKDPQSKPSGTVQNNSAGSRSTRDYGRYAHGGIKPERRRRR